ncbi:MAG: hypothetical protein ACRD3Q_19285 [Terriglobales bacterium]
MFYRLSFFLLVVESISCVSLVGRQIPTTTQPTVQRDQQALAILSQALSAAGGQTAVAAIHDYAATGKVTYSWGDGVQGSVTVKGRGLHQFRVDATFADGVHSWVLNSVTTFQRNPDGSTSPLPSQNTIKPATVIFPLLQILTVSQDTSFSISYGGLVTRNGQQLYDILVQKIFPAASDPIGALSKMTKSQIFIDPKTLTVQIIEDTAYRKDGGPGEYLHDILFLNYQTVNGILVPFSITESIAGQQTMTMQLSQIKFNTGLTDTDFE